MTAISIRPCNSRLNGKARPGSGGPLKSFSEEEVTFFSIHIVADLEHGEKGFEIVEKYATTDEQKETCVRLVKEATMMRRLYLDGVYRKFIAEAEGKKLAA